MSIDEVGWQMMMEHREHMEQEERLRAAERQKMWQKKKVGFQPPSVGGVGSGLGGIDTNDMFEIAKQAQVQHALAGTTIKKSRTVQDTVVIKVPWNILRDMLGLDEGYKLVSHSAEMVFTFTKTEDKSS